VESLQEYRSIERVDLLNECRAMKADGYRMATITALGDLTLLYSFVKDEKQVVLSFNPGDEPVESIGGIYSYAYMYENEIRDLFGINVVNITLDFGGHFYQTSVKVPFRGGKKGE
jgi:ech hydrogenase subunit D